MKVTRKTTTEVTIVLDEAEADKLGGLLYAVPTADPLFDNIAGEIDSSTAQLLPYYAINAAGDYEESEEQEEEII